MTEEIDVADFDQPEEFTPTPLPEIAKSPEQSLEQMAQRMVKALDHATKELNQVNNQIGGKFEQNNQKNAKEIERFQAKQTRFQAEQDEFIHKLEIEFPAIVKANVTAISQGLIDVELSKIAKIIEGELNGVVNKIFTPATAAANKAVDNYRKAGREFYGWQHFLTQAGVSAVIAVVLFSGLKITFGLGEDATYGRKVKTFLAGLEPKSRATLEQAINRK
jgi:hypothetical protein